MNLRIDDHRSLPHVTPECAATPRMPQWSHSRYRNQPAQHLDRTCDIGEVGENDTRDIRHAWAPPRQGWTDQDMARLREQLIGTPNIQKLKAISKCSS
jgi:hypothetical protein